jgi:hypothetical protein
MKRFIIIRTGEQSFVIMTTVVVKVIVISVPLPSTKLWDYRLYPRRRADCVPPGVGNIAGESEAQNEIRTKHKRKTISVSRVGD